MIQVCQRKMERKITHVTLRDRVRCEDLRRSTGMRDASILAERLKWKWSGHVARMDNNRWTHKLTVWDPREGRRNVGRQRTRWADQLKRLAGDPWSRSAKDRVLWKELEKNFNSIGLAHLSSTHELWPALIAGGLVLSGMFG